jgi:iron complex transport system ATP-binding protein
MTFLFVLSSLIRIFASGMETVVLHNLSIGYTAKGNDRVVASGLNAAIKSGELTCLLGQNGIGKSTLLRTLSAFQPALAGEIFIQRQESGDKSQEIGTFTDKELSRLIGVVLTEKPDVQNMTVTELVGMGRSPYTGFWGRLNAEDHQIVAEAIGLVHIEALADRMIHTLSDGERQKVMIAKALAQQTPVIYLDEPTAFLDFPSKVEMMQLLRRLAIDEQKTIFLSTHDVELSLQLADNLWLMEPTGLSVGTPRELAEKGALSRFIERDGITFDRATLQIKVHSS